MDIKTNVMKQQAKELVTIEFRYNIPPQHEDDTSSYKSETLTVGIFDTFDEAMIEGNKALDLLANTFEVRQDDKFQKVYLFGQPRRLVSNSCYPTNGVAYFAEITKLHFNGVQETVDKIMEIRNKKITTNHD
jgi:hypothetical protein